MQGDGERASLARMRPLLAFLILLFAPAAAAQEPSPELAALRGVLAERLALMEDVAQHKWMEGLPVEDLEREAVVLARTLEQAAGAGLDPALAERVVVAQIEAAKRIQSALFGQWEVAAERPVFAAPSLEATLRPEIGRLTDALLRALTAAEGQLGDCAARRALSPLPQTLAAWPDAWALAVQGVLGDAAWCP